jgi:hypothetical protein
LAAANWRSILRRRGLPIIEHHKSFRASTTAFRAGIPLGALALGRIIPIVGISPALYGAGAILVVVSLTLLLLRHNPRVA